ncbi:MAG TPA: P-loop NTPase [Candidatus Binataceae bacterium]|nr:P-loop NTPase [Candidatus Binataceae bacterium]
MRIFTDYPAGAAPPFDSAHVRERIRGNLAGVRSVIAIASAKGGAGKSVISINIAAALALKGRKVAILDADLNSPSVPRMLGMKRERRLPMIEGIEPGAGPHGLRVVWSGMLAGGEPPPVSFVEENGNSIAPTKDVTAEMGYSEAMVRLLSQTQFGELDMVIIDLAPGLDRFHLLSAMVALDAVLLVCHPSGIAADAARHAIDIAKAAGSPRVGIAENMAGYNCDGCRSVRPLFPEGDLPGVAQSGSVPILGRIPFEPRLAEASDRGALFVREWAGTPTGRELDALAQRVETLCARVQAAASSARISDTD